MFFLIHEKSLVAVITGNRRYMLKDVVIIFAAQTQCAMTVDPLQLPVVTDALFLAALIMHQCVAFV